MEPESFDPGESFSGTVAEHEQSVDPADLVEPAHQEQTDPGSQDVNRIRDLPKELGVMLITAGVVGFILPGPGTPAIIAGGLVLWPEAFGKLESWLERAHPKVHREGMKHINRFLDDLQRRYPNSTGE